MILNLGPCIWQDFANWVNWHPHTWSSLETRVVHSNGEITYKDTMFWQSGSPESFFSLNILSIIAYDNLCYTILTMKINLHVWRIKQHPELEELPLNPREVPWHEFRGAFQVKIISVFPCIKNISSHKVPSQLQTFQDRDLRPPKVTAK